ncbi:MAG TPA: MgtC/SapB family protein [Anaerohalosphaeraceae bacterium]|nr:MgtC/SapB family protein [Anaerohalosphaeraceae bacterium]
MELDFWNWPFWMPFVSSVLLGGLIGLEREIRRKPAGLRTNILICLATALFTHLGLSISDDSLEIASRILQGVITGVGFIGAGALIRGTHEIHGITTAATIWLVTGIGIACGFGLYEAAVGVTGIALIILWGLIPLDRRIRSLENDRTGPDNPA